MSEPNWKNRTIWTGDNLDILRGMNSDTVDLIYLDPPFNSNRDYAAPVGSKAAGAAFKDTWHLSDLDVAWMGLIADEEPSIAYLLDTARRTHSRGMQSYLTMMAVRLLEMRRVLKDTGSLYLHCDPTASHYLKLLLDAIFGGGQFRNEITWKRSPGRSHAGHWGNTTDTMLFYAKGGAEPVWHDTRLAAESSKPTRVPLDAAGVRYGESGEPWRDYNPTDIGRHWAVPRSGTLARWIEETHIEGYADITSPHERLDALDRAGLISWSSNGRPSILRPPEADAGVKVNNLWTDIKFLSAGNRERTGYPTQKPLGLLERVIEASSNPGDVVLDPFCGCATALVAAENLERQWVGIDLSPKAVELVNLRLRDKAALFHAGFVTTREDVPRRTDIDALPNYRQNAHVLYGEQEGHCGGCRSHFEFRHLEVDHIVPRSKGGTDHIENLQLLCGHCNRVKGNRPQEYLLAQLADSGVAAVLASG